MEAPSGFEPEMEVLQTSALPLGDGADRNERGRFRVQGSAFKVGSGSGFIRAWNLEPSAIENRK
jgi:hypothetical protein